MTKDNGPDFETLLELIKHTRGFDFTGYKRTTLSRRIQKRMSEIGYEDFAAYADHLESEPGEFQQLFNTILINVTSFFRDPQTWDALRAQVIEPFAENSNQMRIWSAGCASGEETFTIVMLLCETLGEERFKKEVKLYATDADDAALEQARQATYAQKAMDNVPEDLREKYFVPVKHGWMFRNDLRRCVIFGRHDLISDAPISRLDLLVCRNTLIYFNAEAQSRILSRFNFGLKNGGVLFLGKSEMLLTHTRLFTPVDMGARIFRKVTAPDLRERLIASGTARPQPLRLLQVPEMIDQQMQMREVSFEAAAISQIILDRAGVVILANQQARKNLGISENDLGRPIQDLDVSYRPAEIRSRIDEVHTRRETVIIYGVEHQTPAGITYYDIQIEPLEDDGDDIIGVSISFVDVTASHRLRLEVERAQHDLETAYEEMQATNEELETTNEELQSSVEEMETTNEELQSTNEELETLNEELQSTNEELETMNDELRRRTSELNSVNDFMDVVMSSMRSAVVVTDAQMRVQHWNARAQDLWGLRAFEAEGRRLDDLDIGIDLKAFDQSFKGCLQGTGNFDDVVIEAVNRRGKRINVRVSCSRLASKDNTPRGLLVLMEEWDNAGLEPVESA
jgi:two-component system, chemotaxis family, CheB/CheR fusion protein